MRSELGDLRSSYEVSVFGYYNFVFLKYKINTRRRRDSESIPFLFGTSISASDSSGVRRIIDVRGDSVPPCDSSGRGPNARLAYESNRGQSQKTRRRFWRQTGKFISHRSRLCDRRDFAWETGQFGF